MENNNKIFAIVDWYDEKKGFGIARNNSVPLLLHSSYLHDKGDKLKSQDVISCTPVEKNGIYHATDISLANDIDKSTIINQYIKK